MECLQSKLGVFQGTEVEEREAPVSAPQYAEWINVVVADLGFELTHTQVGRQRSHVHVASKL